jgi:hypothetical protein
MKVLYNITEQKVIGWYPNGYLIKGKPATLPSHMAELDYVEEQCPAYNESTHKAITSLSVDLVLKTYTRSYNVVALTTGELTERLQHQAAMNEAMFDNDIVKELLKGAIASATPEEKIKYYSLFPSWKPGISVVAGEVYQWLDTLYEVIQSHTTQYDWPPQVVPALFKLHYNPVVIPNWVQPQGAHDAYKLGDKVRHNNKTWESTINANVWEPGVYGWVEI